MIGKLRSLVLRVLRSWHSKCPVRPIVLIHSDDWGRVGVPSIESIAELKLAGVKVGCSPWDYYGAESVEDIEKLGDTLASECDGDDRLACMTAVMVMANADIPKMRDEGFTEFRAIPIAEGFPPPWGNVNVIEAYQQMIRKGVWYPALHGYTHFFPDILLAGWHDKGEFGHRTRLLLERDIPYLASVTPEFNFALLFRGADRNVFASKAVQRQWIKKGVSLFKSCFGHAPLATCAPGYRSNRTTHKLWSEMEVRTAHTASRMSAYDEDGVLVLPRNVFFEPALDDNSELAVSRAVEEADKAVARGDMIVICTHSINYIQSHLGRRDESLYALKKLLSALLKKYPDLRFANDEEVYTAWSNSNPEWFRKPTTREILRRLH